MPVHITVVLPPMPAFLTCHQFDEPIALGERTVIGRREKLCDVAFPEDYSMSSRHCFVEFDGSGYVVRDLESMNGVYVNDEKIDGVAELLPGDCLRLGGATFWFHQNQSTNPAVENVRLSLIHI